MKLLLDFFPIILFFGTFKAFGIMAATAVAIVATLGQIGWLWRKNGFVEPMQWVSLGVIVVFGGATLLTQDETFIKWKPTVLYWLMGSALWVGHYVFKRNFLRQLMFCCTAGHASLRSWDVLTYGWPITLTPTRG
jgi:intracellular septation protein